jgi:hypothetical protein
VADADVPGTQVELGGDISEELSLGSQEFPRRNHDTLSNRRGPFYGGAMFTSYGFIFLGPGTDSAVDRAVIERSGFRTTLIAVPELSQAPQVARELVDAGVQLVELCGAFDQTATDEVIKAIAGRVPVGVVRYGVESVPGLAALMREQPDS